jgi:tetratricopeptide (TPR) repeat protein
MLREALRHLGAAGPASSVGPSASSPIGGLAIQPLAVAESTYLGWTLAELGEFAEAIHCTEASLLAVESADDPFAVMMACMGVGMVRVRQGNAPAAIPPLERGLQVCYRADLTALAFHGIAASLGAAYVLTNRVAEAIPLLRKVADQAGAMKLISDHLLGAIPLGEAWLTAGRLDDAAHVGQQSLALARRHRQRGHEVYALRLLGAVAAHRDPHDPRAAAVLYQEALALAHELGMRPLVAHCHLGLGKLYRNAGNHETAREHLALAAAMYREMQMRYWLEQA